MVENEKHKVPVEGSLGLLAQGAKGLRAWRRRKEEWKAEKRDQ